MVYNLWGTVMRARMPIRQGVAVAAIFFAEETPENVGAVGAGAHQHQPDAQVALAFAAQIAVGVFPTLAQIDADTHAILTAQ